MYGHNAPNLFHPKGGKSNKTQLTKLSSFFFHFKRLHQPPPSLSLSLSLPAETLLNFYQLCFRNGSVAEMLGKTSLCDEESFGTLCCTS